MTNATATNRHILEPASRRFRRGRAFCRARGLSPRRFLDDLDRFRRAEKNNRTYGEQLEKELEETKDIPFFITPLGIIPNGYYNCNGVLEA